ncbi:DUF3857 domain-containing protein [Psychroserpens ponticola]|uniref:DUF3857 domain-containing protein n=1 Tax=Psychroserpens ponticola TaxID=2932268 RepID=A0ABY7S128_9FLAO|nr:DUF3857 domain-containing protein [Psychroserpens ponticola]WCO02161.1 DUF3857 domain-containing protein [Psychroserpens ponticola]
MKKLVIIAVLIIAQTLTAQNYKFGKVSEAELLEKSHPEYPDATAAILYKKQKVKFDYQQGKGFIQNNEIHQRIKIYTKEGFDYATKSISLYVGGNSTSKEEVLGLKAYTYNIEGGKIIKDKLKNDGVFEEETNKYRKTTKFTMPNIKEGCIIEFEYTVQSQLYGIDDIDFQQLIPTKKLDISLNMPEYLVYKTFLNPRASYLPEFVNSKKNRTVTITSKERSKARAGGITEYNTSKITFMDVVVEADLSNIPPLKDENYIDNLRNYQSRLIVELERLEFPGDPIQYFSNTWEKVTKSIYDNSDFGDQLKKKNYYKDELDALLSGVPESDAQQRAALIFNHVKSKVKWNDYYGYTSDEGVVKAYKTGTGNSGDINLMLTSMLRYAGLDANPVLVSTKSNGIPLVPTRKGFNYLISTINIDGNIVLLDATRKFNTANILPTNTLNWLGRLIKEDGSSDWVDLIPKMSSKESVSLNVKLSEDLSASGKVRHQYTDYQAKNIRNKFENHNDDEIIESLEKDKGEIEISEVKLDHMNDVNKPINESYSYVLNNAMEDIGGNLYVTPLLFLANNENPFKDDTRVYPIDFVYPIADKFMVNMMIPEGYAIESLPESVKYQFNGTDGEFTYLAKENGNFIQFIVSLDLNKTLILPSEYEQFKEFYQLMIEKQTEQVVLKKK